MKAPIKIENGQVFAFPLNAGGYGIAVIARSSVRRRPRTKYIYCYLMPYHFKTWPKADQIGEIKPELVAFRFCTVAELIVEGRWRVVAQVAPFERSQWPMPIFGHFPGMGLYQLAWKDEDDPSTSMRLEEVKRNDPRIQVAVEDSLYPPLIVELVCGWWLKLEPRDLSKEPKW